MMNHKLGDATTDAFAEVGNWCLGEKGFEARDKEFNVFSEFRNETVDKGFKKHFIVDEVYRIIKPVLEGVGKIKRASVAKQARDIVSDIADLIISLQSSNVDINRIPPLNAVALEDGSFLIEWIFSKYRIGFVLGRNKRESIWYLVSTIEGNVEASGPLSGTDYKKLLAELILFVFGYS
jgi:hypothetical protein